MIFLMDNNSCIIKRYAYVEFETEDGASNGLQMHDSIFLGRPIKVCSFYPKFTNIEVKVVNVCHKRCQEREVII